MKKKKVKKGEVASRAFVYIITLIVIGVIFFMGQNFFISQKDTASKVELASLKSKVIADVATATKEFGSFKKAAYKVQNIQEICFVDGDVTNAILSSSEINQYPLIKDSISSETGKNVFVYGSSLLDSYNAGEILVLEVPHFKCIPSTNGELVFALEWKEGKARVLPGLTPLGDETTLESLISLFGNDISELEEFDEDIDGELSALFGESETTSNLAEDKTEKSFLVSEEEEKEFLTPPSPPAVEETKKEEVKDPPVEEQTPANEESSLEEVVEEVEELSFVEKIVEALLNFFKSFF